jgi:hypothetical protein
VKARKFSKNFRVPLISAPFEGRFRCIKDKASRKSLVGENNSLLTDLGKTTCKTLICFRHRLEKTDLMARNS